MFSVRKRLLRLGGRGSLDFFGGSVFPRCCHSCRAVTRRRVLLIWGAELGGVVRDALKNEDTFHIPL